MIRPGAQRVVDVVGVVGDVVGDRGGLRLEAGVGLGHQVGAGRNIVEPERQPLVDVTADRAVLGVDQRAVVLEDALEGLPAEVQAVVLGVAVLEARHDAQRLQVVVKAAPERHLFVQNTLAGVPERGVAEIVSEGDRLRQVFVEPQCPRDRARHLADLERMGQPGAEVLAFVLEEDLRLVLQPPKRRRMDDAVAVALEFRARGARRNGVEPPAAVGRIGGIRCLCAHLALFIGIQRY